MKNKSYCHMKLILGLFFLFLFSSCPGQFASIKGVVYDSDNSVIPGASITIIELDAEYIGKDDGSYEINKIEPGSYTIVFGFFGFEDGKYRVELKSGQELRLDGKLGEDETLDLDEVVVVGYGTRQRRDIIGSVTSLKSEDIENSVSPSIDQALQGKAAGVQITAANGVAGGGNTKIQIRGSNSINAGSNPLIVVDGIPISNLDVSADVMGSGTNALADLNMDDIESVDILKDASSSAIYGARGANGVIIITTKKGKEGKTRFNFNYKTGIVQETNRLSLLNATDHLNLRDQVSIENTGFPEPENTVIGVFEGVSYTREDANAFAAKGGSNWIEETLRTGSFHEANLSASSGTEKNRLYFSGAYRNEDSFLRGNNFERVSGRFNVENRSHDIVSLGANLGLTYSINNRVPTGDNGGLGWAQQIPTYIPIYKEDGTFFNPAGNPIWFLENRTFEAKRLRSLSTLYADFKLHKNIHFRTNFGLDYTNLHEDEYQAKNEAGNTEAWAWERSSNILNWNTSNYLTYEVNINDEHDLNSVVGMDVQRTDVNGLGIYGYGFSNESFTNPQQGSSQSLYSYQTGNAIVSYYSRLSYKWRNKYLFGFTARSDGSSRFSNNYRYGFFPSFSAGWILTDEDFLGDSQWLNYLKLKSSYGLTGNDNIGDFTRFGLYSTGVGYVGGLALYPTSLANPNLRWERAKMLDVSVEYGVFKNKISGSLTYFNKQSSDLLLPIQLPTSSGFNVITVNAGMVNNWGIEFMLNSHNITMKRFRWKTDFNFSLIRNKVLDVANLPPDAFESGQPGEGRVIVGYPVGQTFVVQYAGVMEENGELIRYNTDGSVMVDNNGDPITVTVNAGEALFYDVNGNLMAFGVDDGGTPFDSEDDVNRFTGTDFYDNRVPRGNPLPKFYAGVGNTLTFGDFECNFLFNVVWGHTIYDDPAKNQIGMLYSYAQRPEIQGAFTPDNPSSNVPALNTTVTPINSDRFLYDGSFVRLRSLTLSYALSKRLCKKLHLSSLKVYLTGYNLWTWTRYPGWDPEVLRHVPQNSQQENISFSGPSWQTPQAKIMLFGIKMGM